MGKAKNGRRLFEALRGALEDHSEPPMMIGLRLMDALNAGAYAKLPTDVKMILDDIADRYDGPAQD